MDSVDKAFFEGLGTKTAAQQEDTTLEPVELPLHVGEPGLTGVLKAKVEPREPVTQHNLFRNHDTHPVVLDIFLSNFYGPIWVTWLPESLWFNMEKNFKTSISSLAKDKINAMQTIHMVDSYWDDWEIFEKVTQALNNNIVRFDITQPVSLGQMMNSVSMVNGVRNDTEFSDEVSRYIGAMAAYNGIEYLPAPLNFAQKEIGAAPKDVVARLKDFQSAEAKVDDLKENAADIQALQILAAQSYVQYRKDQLKQQTQALS